MGKLRVWWIPQVPGKAIYIPVNSIEEANLVIELLGEYDNFQFQNKIKPDYSNVGGLQEWDDTEQEWCDWYSEGGEDLKEYNKRNGYQKRGIDWDGYHW
jgi:hypothetical protein